MKNNGSTIWSDTDAGRELQQRLADERTARGLEHLLARIDTLEKAVDRLSNLLDQGPGMVSMVTDMADETYRQAAAKGVNLEERLGNALQIAEKLTSPTMLENINKLTQTMEQGPGLMAMTVDMVDEMYRRSAANGLDLQEVGNITGKTLQALSEASRQPAPKAGGMFSLLKAIKDPDRQKAIGFWLNLTKSLGKRL